MELPEDLDAWTFATVQEAVRRHEYEPARLDFKEVLHAEQPKDRPEHNENIRRCASSMANASGGYILFGVRDPKAAPATTEAPVESRIIGIPLGGDLRRELGDKLKGIELPLQFDARAIPLPADASWGVLVAAIPLSPLRPHMDPTTHRFYRRDAGGKAEPMNYFEVRDQMLYSSQRLRQLTLLRLELHTYRRLASAVRQDATTWLVHFDTDTFKTLLANICDLLPADDQLLENLHLAATLAGIVSDALRAGYGQWTKTPRVVMGIPGVPQFMLRKLQTGFEASIAEFERVCADCEAALDALFGPINITAGHDA